jgi:hypothetical protein
MKLEDIPKFVINLKRRPDRLESIQREMDYVGWDYELFEAIDTNSYMGCTLSHLKIIDICETRGYEKVIIIEDDTYFMPYFKSLLNNIQVDLSEIDYFNFGPTLHRPVNKSLIYENLINLSDLPPKENDNQRGIFTTNCVLYDRKIFNEIRKISETKFSDASYFYSIDDYIYQFIMPKYRSFCPIYPMTTQGSFFSDVSGDVYNNFYTLTYNWNLYSPYKIPSIFCSLDSVQNIKKNKGNVDINFNE